MVPFALLGLFAGMTAEAADADPFATSASLAIGTGTLQGESPALGGEGPSASLNTSVAENLVVFRYNDGDEDPILSQVLVTELHGGWTFGDRWRIDAFLPLYPYAEAPWSPYQGFAAGDARLQATVPLAGEPDGAFAFAFVPRLGLPTGSQRAYLGRGVSAGAHAVLGGEVADQRAGWLLNLGLTGSPAHAIEDVSLGSTVDGRLGGWWRVDDAFRVGAETDLLLGLPRAAGRANTVSTGHLFAQLSNPDGLSMTVGAGTGLVAGLGAPDWRLFAGISYGNLHRDKDKDGLYDDVDACPLDPEDMDAFEDEDGCPEVDNDRDGIADTTDRCPVDPEDLDDFADDDGCPENDNDNDTVVDTADACPLVPGSPEFAGCPDTDKDGLQDTEDQCPDQAGPRDTGGCPDRDSDLVPDFRDRCPDEPKPADEDPASSDGCPKRVYIVGNAIRITDKVFFETAKATIKKESLALLDEVAKVINDNARIRQVEVAGHTDDQGSESYNQKLSQRRAESVRDYLVKAGVDKGKLTAKGYGEGAPIDTNRTEIGRGNNRRVEFNILEQDPPKREITQPPGPRTTPAPPAPATPAPATPAAPTVTTPPAGAAGTGLTQTPGGGATALLTVNVYGANYADVYVDDRKLGKTAPFRNVPIEPGTHTIVVVNVRSGLQWEQEVDVRPGDTLVIDAGAKPAGAGESDPWGTPAGDDPWR